MAEQTLGFVEVAVGAQAAHPQALAEQLRAELEILLPRSQTHPDHVLHGCLDPIALVG
jgi:hypothetical protein